MDGDFRSDITRDTFRRTKHFSRVIRQQGRVDIDADLNELVDILLHYQRTVTSDIIGPHAGPLIDAKLDFGISPWTPKAANTPDNDKDEQEPKKDHDSDEKRKQKRPQPPQQQDTGAYEFIVGKGRYYVDGILCECVRDRYIYSIPTEVRDPKNTKDAQYLLYLDVWEREVSAYEDDSIREVARGGPDTATRAVVEWRIQVLPDPLSAVGSLQLDKPLALEKYNTDNQYNWQQFNEDWTVFVLTYAPYFFDKAVPNPHDQPRLKARTEMSTEGYTDPCTIPPSSTYRGPENQLYRVEIHRSGTAYTQNAPVSRIRGDDEQKAKSSDDTLATFTWSRENGSVAFPIVGSVNGGSTITVTVNDIGRDDSRFSLHIDDWVEIVDVEEVVEGDPGPLLQVTAIDDSTMQVTLKAYGNQQVVFDNDDIGQVRPRVLRRWDYKRGDPSQKGALELASDGAAKVIENTWIRLEDGIQIQFYSDYDGNKDADDMAGPSYYRTGQYWLIPARTATGDIEWPYTHREHHALPPQGVTHHYAPLALLTLTSGKISDVPNSFVDLRRKIKEGWLPSQVKES